MFPSAFNSLCKGSAICGVMDTDTEMASYLIPEFILSKLYVNSLFATLNAREKWNGLLRDDRPTSFLQFNNNINHNGSEQVNIVNHHNLCADLAPDVSHWLLFFGNA